MGQVVPQGWQRLGHVIYKANVDGIIFRSEGKMGVRAIVRDGEGKVMGALSEKMPGRLAVEEVEALAMRRIVLFVQEIGLSEEVF